MIFQVDDITEFKNKVDNLKLVVTTVKQGKGWLGLATNGVLVFSISIPNSEALDYFYTQFDSIDEELIQKTVLEPFAEKGKNNFRGTGTKEIVQASTIADVDFVVPYNVCCYNGIEILNGDYGDSVNLKILDTAEGTYSGTPNAVLNQFGIDWNMKKEFIQILPYEATIYKGMVICVQYTNNQSADKEIYINHYLHEIIN